MKAIRIFIFGNIYISLCAVLMVTYTNYIFDIKENTDLLSFIFFATLTSYSFHWYLTPDLHSSSERYIWVNNNKFLIINLLAVSSIFTLVFIFHLSEHIILISIISTFTFIYSASKIPFRPFVYLRKIIIGKTAYLAIIWTFVTAVLPVIVSKTSWTTENTIFFANRFLLIYPICLLFDYRDKDEDKKQNIKNIVAFLSLNGLKRLYYICLILFFISSLILCLYGFSLWQIIVIIIPGIFLSLSFNYSIRTKSDYWFYFYLDGLMMLSAILIIIKNIFQ